METFKVENNGNGFSLIKLVVVISVLSILSSITLSIFHAVKEKAADVLVKVSLLNTCKECKIPFFQGKKSVLLLWIWVLILQMVIINFISNMTTN